MSSVTSYRSQPAQLSDSDSSASDDEDQPWKRQKKVGTVSRKETPMVVSSARESVVPFKSTVGSFKRKRNNVWGEVVQQQEEEQVARDITQFDMYSSKERDVESYSYQSWDDGGAVKQQPLGNPITYDDPAANQNRKLPAALGGSNDDAWLVDGEEKTPAGVKDRLGSSGDMNDKRQKKRMKSYDNEMKFVELSSDMHRKDVAGKIAYSLQEPKREMVKIVVDELGIEKSIAIWKEAWEIEQNGGMMVNNGSRRRTPGGVFFQLLKTDPDIPMEKKDVMFAMSAIQSKQEGKSRRKRIRRKQRTNAMDTEQADKIEIEAEIDGEDAQRNEGERQERGEVREQIKNQEKYNPSISKVERTMKEAEADRHVDDKGDVKETTGIVMATGVKTDPDDMEDGEISD